MTRLLLILIFVTLSGAVLAIERPDFSPQPGTQVDMSASLSDSLGETRTLAGWLGGRPGLLLFGYHDCPNLCGVAQQAIAGLLAKSGLSPSDYVPMFVTLAPEEGVADAAGARQRLAEAVGPDEVSAWRFMSGRDGERLGAELGIGAIERERIQQFVHPLAVFTLTPKGRLSHALPGLELTANDLRLAVVEASAGRIGTVIDQVLLLCAGYDPTTGQYTPIVFAALRVGAIAVLVVLVGTIVLLEVRKRRWTA